MASRRLGMLRPQEAALFLCDMQEKFRPSIQFFMEIVSVSKRLLNASQILGLPVVVTEQYPTGMLSPVSHQQQLGLISPFSCRQLGVVSVSYCNRVLFVFCRTGKDGG